jgi:hypothetical protein
MAFVRKEPQSVTFEDPEQLYLKLTERGAGPGPLWSHQADVLRSWHGSHLEHGDVALELPTGAGKTLVSGLIAEFRRRTATDRVAYLCLTRQLAKQTADRLTEYQIPNVLLTGHVTDWNRAHRAQCTSAAAVAVTTYSHVFNSNPAINDAACLILDDAHGAAGYVASPWSLELDRDDDATVYQDVLSLIAPALDPLVVTRFQSVSAGTDYATDVFLASPIAVDQTAGDLESLFESAGKTGQLRNDIRYAYSKLQGHLDRCMFYVSFRRLQIRPLVPPTSMHAAFDSPARRIYVSATLGNGGELERSFGRKQIRRIPAPKGWDKRGTGRRFFCFPELTKDLSSQPTEVDAWVKGTIGGRRSLVLTPDGRTASVVAETLVPDGEVILHAADVEEDLDAFTSQEAATLILNNRYDGIDLPDEDCRLVVLDGFPAKGDLQERFLYGSLGAENVLNERIRARISQGAGRATRNTRDFATVVVLGDTLVTYLGRQDVLAAMHPELHAEIEFGWEQSLANNSDGMTENIAVFDRHDSDWTGLDDEIVAARDTYQQASPLGTTELQAAAPHEVAACDAIWNCDWNVAITEIRAVLDALQGGRASSRYAALWSYLAASICARQLSATGDEQYAEAATTYFERAKGAARGTTWLSHLAAPGELTATEPPVDPVDQVAAENAAARIATGNKGKTADEAFLQTIRADLEGTNPTAYERGLDLLGQLAGATETLPGKKVSAAPDGAWLFGDALWITWEAKSDMTTGQLGANYVRETGSHLRYIANKRSTEAPGGSFGTVVTPQDRIHDAALWVAEDHVYLVTPTTVLDIFDRVARAWRQLRAIPKPTAEFALTLFRDNRALPSQWVGDLQTQRLRDL